ncbi:MAG: PEP-CTERM sorting domain-containing protein [Bryobacterales bacterium]|nr:PEP-CTERM sorting domain-containing protein [Bryobacterales bacterium]
MRLPKLFALVSLLQFAVLPSAIAGPVLYEWALNIDGTLHDYFSPGALPPGVLADPGIATQTTGLGSVAVTVTGAGAHSVTGFFDHEIDELINTFFNEFGAVSGVAPAGLRWEIDEPGYVFGNIFAHVISGPLDNTNGVPAGSPDDVSLALAWNFVLGAGQTGHVHFLVDSVAPAAGFYLTQTDPDSGSSIFLSGGLEIEGGAAPEPASYVLLLTGIVGIALGRRYRQSRVV